MDENVSLAPSRKVSNEENTAINDVVVLRRLSDKMVASRRVPAPKGTALA
jgi:hypothetical protein